MEIEHGKDDNRDAGVTFSSFAEFVDNYKKLDQYLVHNVDGPMRGMLSLCENEIRIFF